MAIDQQLINKFNSFNNIEFIHTEKISLFTTEGEPPQTVNIFLLACIVVSQKPDIEITPSFFSSEQQLLKNRLNKYVQENYGEEVLKNFDESEEQFELVEYFSNYKILYYYAFNDQETLSKINKNIKQQGIDLFQDDLKKQISSIQFPADKKVFAFTIPADITSVPEKYKEWYYYKVENDPKENLIENALETILFFKRKKGKWIKSSISIKKQIKDDYENIIIDNNIKLSDLEKKIAALKEPSTETDINLVLTEDLDKDNIAFFSKIEIDPQKKEAKEKVKVKKKQKAKESADKKVFEQKIIGFPKSLIELFPSISPTDEAVEITDKLNFQKLNKIKENISNLKQLLNSKNTVIEKQGKKIANYDYSNSILQVEEFISELSDELDRKAIDDKDNVVLRFGFTRTKCDDKDEFCKKIFVDGQTNLELAYVYAEKTPIVPNSAIIDNKLSAFLFLKAEEILSSEFKEPKQATIFFKDQVYKETQIVDNPTATQQAKESFFGSTIYTLGKRELEKNFVTDPVNIVKQNKIKENFLKIIDEGNSVSEKISNTLSTVSSVTELYQKILNKYYLTDLVDELASCISPGKSLEDITTGFIEKKISELLKEVLKVEADVDKNLSIFSTCIGLEKPLTVKNFKESKNRIKIPDSIKTLGKVDFFLTTSIKCFDKVYSETEAGQQLQEKISKLDFFKVKNPLYKGVEGGKIDEGGQTEFIYDLNSLKQPISEQYDLLVQEAKTFKKNPGAYSSDKLGEISPIGSDFSIFALRNASLLLQEQIIKEVKKLIIVAWKAAILALVNKIKNACKKDAQKDPNKKEQAGDLSASSVPSLQSSEKNNSLDAATSSSAEDLDDLIEYIFSSLIPSEACSLFNGTADTSLYKKILEQITEDFPALLTGPIILNGKKFFDSLSDVSMIKEFFILLSTEFPQYSSKCSDYLSNISNIPSSIDYGKCIDFTPQYKEEKVNQLMKAGFTKEQAEKIADEQIQIQEDDYLDLMYTKQVGIYNEVTSQLEQKEIKMSNEVKKKIDKNLSNLFENFGNIIDLYKEQLTSFYDVNNVKIPVILEKSSYKVGNNVVNVRKKGNVDYSSEYFILFIIDKNTISLKSNNYSNVPSTLDIIEEIRTTFYPSSDDKKVKKIIENFVANYEQFLLNEEIKKNNYFKKQKFFKQMMIDDINSFIYFKG